MWIGIGTVAQLRTPRAGSGRLRAAVIALCLTAAAAGGAEGDPGPLFPGGRDCLALVIGIDRYEDREIPPLRCAERDATALARLLSDPARGGIPDRNVKMLLGEQATVAAIRRELRALRAAAPDGLVVILFSGHGGVLSDGRACWVGFDSRRADLDRTGLPAGEIRDAIRAVPAVRLVAFVDSCHAAATLCPELRSRDIAKPALRGRDDMGRGRIVIAGARGEELAWEDPRLGGGIFTGALLRGLRGEADADRDSCVTIEEIWNWVEREVPKTAARSGRIQTPFRDPPSSGVAGGFVLVAVPDAETDASPEAGDGRERGSGHVTAGGRFSAPPWADVVDGRPDPAAVPDPDLRRRILDCGRPFRIRHRESGVLLQLVPPGAYLRGARRGDADASADELPRRCARVPAPLYVAVTEVTNDAFARFNPRHESGELRGYRIDHPDQPVARVSWDDARAFCNHFGLRLLTDSEWEYIARGGVDGRFPWGDGVAGAAGAANVLDRAGLSAFPAARDRSFDIEDCAVVAAATGSFRGNGFGLCDVIGNVWEWVADGPTDSSRERAEALRFVRGGSFLTGPDRCRASHRETRSRWARLPDTGFRVVADVH